MLKLKRGERNREKPVFEKEWSSHARTFKSLVLTCLFEILFLKN